MESIRILFRPTLNWLLFCLSGSGDDLPLIAMVRILEQKTSPVLAISYTVESVPLPMVNDRMVEQECQTLLFCENLIRLQLGQSSSPVPFSLSKAYHDDVSCWIHKQNFAVRRSGFVQYCPL